MPDLGKVIYSLERCICHVPDACRDCVYDAGHPYNECVELLLRDALELLKAQEPKPPIVKENAYGWKFFYCPSCGREFNANRKHGCVNAENFCDKCGQAVKWDG